MPAAAVQYRNMSILNISSGQPTGLYMPYLPLSEFESFKLSGTIRRAEKATAALSESGLKRLHRQTEGHCRNRIYQPGAIMSKVLKVGACGEYSDVEELLDDMERMEISMGEDGR